ncbi:hypothetical protein ONB66_00275 [Candidatus Vidania fulgoroideae]|uniref:50S ribosomal protein L24 n=1 Tax=Candidatus Vidania fulgoroideorum TaxID=881286 RepID=A0AAX3N9W3_9PROT|nr:hypothetical protein ONB67_00605 [Candidatus Vidania fulgoroideae]WDR79454.1 hypothetical protein ONB66_00275 [Candidatus Vidania fulgoroideae]
MKYKIGEKVLIKNGKNKNIIAYLIYYKNELLFLKNKEKKIKIYSSSVKIY